MGQSLVEVMMKQKRKQWQHLAAPVIVGCWHPGRGKIHQGSPMEITRGSQSRDGSLTRGSNVRVTLDSYICTKPGYRR